MATNFPNSLDTSTELPAESAGTPLSTNHVTAHQNIQDAIEAIEAKVGVDSSAVTTSHDYKLSGVTGSDLASSLTGTETLTNKTLTSPVINVGSDAEGDMYYRNSGGAYTRLARGTDDYILKMNGNVPNWEAEAVISDGSYATKGILQGLTDASTSGLTIASGVISVNSGTSANNIVKLDSNGEIPLALKTSFAGVPYSSGVLNSTQNVDTTYTCGFTAKLITIYYKLRGLENSVDKYTFGVATFDGTTLKSNLVYAQDGASTVAFTMGTVAFLTSSITAGGTTGNSMKVDISINSVSATQFVIRSSFLTSTSNNGAIDYIVTAVR